MLSASYFAHLYFPLATFFNGRDSVMSSSLIEFSGTSLDEDITNVLGHLDVRVKPNTKASWVFAEVSENKHTVTLYTDKNNEILRFKRMRLKSRKQMFANHLNPSTCISCIQIHFSDYASTF